MCDAFRRGDRSSAQRTLQPGLGAARYCCVAASRTPAPVGNHGRASGPVTLDMPAPNYDFDSSEAHVKIRRAVELRLVVTDRKTRIRAQAIRYAHGTGGRSAVTVRSWRSNRRTRIPVRRPVRRR